MQNILRLPVWVHVLLLLHFQNACKAASCTLRTNFLCSNCNANSSKNECCNTIVCFCPLLYFLFCIYFLGCLILKSHRNFRMRSLFYKLVFYLQIFLKEIIYDSINRFIVDLKVLKCDIQFYDVEVLSKTL